MQEIIKFVESLCEGKGTLLYLVKFGSHLYGTNTENSDTDYKGIFLPNLENLILEKKCQSIVHHTSSDRVRNSNVDVDIDLWSLQHWFALLKRGDTNAIDMLFSYTNKDSLVYISQILMETQVFKSPMDYINLRENTSYIAYAHHQAKKYGLKGSRLHLLKSVYDKIIKDLDENKYAKQDVFGVLIPELKDLFFDEKLCFSKRDAQDYDILYICGSGFHEKTKISEVVQRLETTYKKYGERAVQAEQNENVDWKAISHAVRCTFQIEELVKTNHLVFPLKNAEHLKDIKAGKYTWKECEKDIAEGLAKLEVLLEQMPINNSINKVHESSILSCYKGK